MKAWLAGIQLVDVHHNPRKLVYRLVGQVDVDFRGYNPTGRTVEECGVGQSLEESLRNYEIAITNRSSLSAVGVDAAERFQADAATLSLFAVVQLAVYGGLQIPIGVLLDRYGSRPIMVIGMLLMGLGQFVMAVSPSIGVALIARVLLGAGDAAIFPAVLRLVATWFPAQRGPVMGQLTGLVGQTGQLIALPEYDARIP